MKKINSQMKQKIRFGSKSGMINKLLADLKIDSDPITIIQCFS